MNFFIPTKPKEEKFEPLNPKIMKKLPTTGVGLEIIDTQKIATDGTHKDNE